MSYTNNPIIKCNDVDLIYLLWSNKTGNLVKSLELELVDCCVPPRYLIQAA